IEGGRGLLHEIPNQLTMVRSVTKHAERATLPSEIPGLVDRAIRELWDGRVRPVEIEIPPDTLFAEENVQLLAAAPDRQRVEPDPDHIAEAAKLLGESESSIIFAGGGVHGAEAWEELREFAEMLQAPVVMSQNGKGAISSRHYLGYTEFAGMEQLEKADVIFL